MKMIHQSSKKIDHTFVFALALCLPLILIGQAECAFEPFVPDARQMALSGIVPTNEPGALTGIFHPAVLGLLKSPEIRLSTLLPFSLQELTTTSFAACFPFHCSSGGLSFSSYGFELYRETIIGLHLARRFWTGVFLGTSLRRASLDIKGFRKSSISLFDASGVFRLHPKLDLGGGFLNLSSGDIGGRGEKPPREVFLHGTFRPTPNVSFYFGLKRCDRAKDQVALAAEIELTRELYFRAGGQEHPGRIFLGFGIRLDPVVFDYSLSPHETLEESHCFGLGYTREVEK